MDEEQQISIEIIPAKKRGRMKQMGNTKQISITLPRWLLERIDEEAKEKDKTRSLVISYLLFCGLKAHTGEFLYPKENTIKRNWLKRGRTWYGR